MATIPVSDHPEGLTARIADVRARIARASDRSARDSSSVTLIGISKTHPASLAADAVRAGVGDLGENRVQEAAAKAGALEAAGLIPRWHLVGHLQSNKARVAAGLFDILHSVDSDRLASAVSGSAEKPIGVLIEVNVAGEASKFGVAPADAGALAERIARMPMLNLLGLMTVAPQADDPEDVRPVFRTLRELRDAIGLADLSMGMTEDFEVAVEEGATFVRVGRAIFGSRGV